MSFTEMKSRRPYLIPHLYEWMVDSSCTVHLLIDVNYPGADVPSGYDDMGTLVLDVSPAAIRELNFGDHALSFLAQFQSKTFNLYVPYGAVTGIVAVESAIHIAFDDDADPESPPPRGRGHSTASHLKIVK